MHQKRGLFRKILCRLKLSQMISIVSGVGRDRGTSKCTFTFPKRHQLISVLARISGEQRACIETLHT